MIRGVGPGLDKSGIKRHLHCRQADLWLHAYTNRLAASQTPLSGTSLFQAPVLAPQSALAANVQLISVLVSKELNWLQSLVVHFALDGNAICLRSHFKSNVDHFGTNASNWFG